MLVGSWLSRALYGRLRPYQERFDLRGDPHDDPKQGEFVEFRLTYDGPLFASGNKKTHVQHKHDIRRVFHAQLKRLWEMNPQLLEYREAMPLDMGKISYAGNPEPTRAEYLAEKFGCEDYRFVPLVTEELEIICALEILILRPDKPGSLIQSGDIDGRLKTIFDALRKPSNKEELAGNTPEPDEKPFYCLLEDDKLITHISIRTDVLLEPVCAKKDVASQIGPYPKRQISHDDVRLLLSVTLRPTKLGWGNLDFI
jgi:hypothetical protein